VKHKLDVRQRFSRICKKGRHTNEDITSKTQEVMHRLKTGFDWGIVSSFKHCFSRKMINCIERAKEQENITDLENLIYDGTV